MTAPTQERQGLSAAQIAAIVVLARAQAQTRQQLTRTAVEAALAPFRAFTGWWNPTAVSRAVAQVLRVVQPTQRQAAQVTDAFVARVVSQMTGRTVRPVGTVDVTTLRRAISEQVARELVDGTRRPPFVLLGEFQPQQRRTVPAETIDDEAPTVVPEPAPASSRGRTGARASRAQAEQLRAAAREAARVLREQTRQARAGGGRPSAASTAQALQEALRRGAAITRTEQEPDTGTGARIEGALDPGEAYGRVAEQYRYQVVAEGVDESTARQRALVRLQLVAQTDVTLAVRQQYHASLTQLRGVTGYRRIVRPELSESGPCGLCIVAADRLYRIEHLLPIHARCVCDVLPVMSGLDPGLDLNDDDLDALYKAAGTTSGRQQGKKVLGLKNIRVALTEHGELGPVLVDADRSHRGPAEVARTRHPDRQVRDRAQLEAFEARLDMLLARRGHGEEGLEEPIRWQTARVEALRRELAGTPTPAPARRASTARRRERART